jgi:uncharacterized protein (DUF488 family)
MASGPAARLYTVGHGTLSSDAFTALLHGAAIESLVDVRIAPGSRRHPQFGRPEMERWLPAAGVDYRWEKALGGFRRPSPDSPNTALRHEGFRGYADYMVEVPFMGALEAVLEEAGRQPLTVMCAEALWWRCHRRLIADAAMVLRDVEVVHLGHDGRLSPHRPTEGLRRDGDHLVYDGGQPKLAT